jgi:transcriptional regulator GlxA family with amidase domain
MDGRIFHLRNQILNNLKHQWTVEEMADYVELSAAHLQKLFKSQMGMPPIAYLRELRLEKARELLENSFSPTKLIGYEVGMCDQSHFSCDFKKKYGVTPTEYRKFHWKRIQYEKQSEKK